MRILTLDAVLLSGRAPMGQNLYNGFSRSHDLLHPFFPDLPEVAAHVKNRPIINLKTAQPALADLSLQERMGEEDRATGRSHCINMAGKTRVISV